MFLKRNVHKLSEIIAQYFTERPIKAVFEEKSLINFYERENKCKNPRSADFFSRPTPIGGP